VQNVILYPQTTELLRKSANAFAAVVAIRRREVQNIGQIGHGLYCDEMRKNEDQHLHPL